MFIKLHQTLKIFMHMALSILYFKLVCANNKLSSFLTVYPMQLAKIAKTVMSIQDRGLTLCSWVLHVISPLLAHTILLACPSTTFASSARNAHTLSVYPLSPKLNHGPLSISEDVSKNPQRYCPTSIEVRPVVAVYLLTF